MPPDGREVDGKKTAGRYCIGNANLAVPQDGLEVCFCNFGAGPCLVRRGCGVVGNPDTRASLRKLISTTVLPLQIASPFTDGILTDWDAVEAIYDHAFKDQLRLDLKAHPLLFGEPSHTGRATREKQVELVFEKYDTPGKVLLDGRQLSFRDVVNRGGAALAVCTFVVWMCALATSCLLRTRTHVHFNPLPRQLCFWPKMPCSARFRLGGRRRSWWTPGMTKQ